MESKYHSISHRKREIKLSLNHSCAVKEITFSYSTMSRQPLVSERSEEAQAVVHDAVEARAGWRLHLLMKSVCVNRD